MNFIDLENKVIVLIGGEGFLGKEFCKILHYYGCIVVSADLKADMQNSYFRQYRHVDITKEESVKELVNNILLDYGKINIMVNLAAINPQPQNSFIEFENYLLDDWKKTIDVNLTGVFICCKEFGKVMKKGSVIVNVVSELGLFAPDQTIYNNYIKPSDYGVSKAGVINLTKYLASYWRDKIRINNLVLGSVYNNHKEDFVNKLSKKIPLDRMAYKDEYNEALLFLCSDASSYMTGQNLILNGGRGIF